MFSPKTINNSTSIPFLAANNIFTGINTFVNSYDNLNILSYSATPSVSYLNGQLYYMPTTAACSSLEITSIPTTPQACYVFSFVFEPSTANSPLYFTGTSVTLNGTSTALKGTISLPTTYSYLVQSITIINTSTTTTPSFIALNSVQGF